MSERCEVFYITAKNVTVEKKFIYISIVITFCMHLLRICKINELNVSMDEIGTLASAAYLSGNNWVSVLQATRYYGQGFYWLYAFLFRATDNPYIIASTIYVCNSLMVSVTTGIIYYIAVRFLKMKNNYWTSIASILPCLCYSYVNWKYISNDVPVLTAFWLLILFFCLSYANRKDRKSYVIYSICAAFEMGYLLTIHEKTIAIWIAVGATVILFKILFDESIVHFIAFGISAIFSYIGARWIKASALTLLWSEVKSSVGNTSAFSQTSTWLLNKPLGWKIMLDIIVTNFLTLCERTGGLVAIALVVIIVMLIYCIKVKVCRRKIGVSNTIKLEFFIMLVAFFTVGIIVLGLANQWSPSLFRAYYMNDRVGKGVRAYSYERYYIAFVGPALLVICAKLKYIVFKFKWIIYASIGILVLLDLYYFGCIHTYLVDKWNTTSLSVLSVFPDVSKNWNVYLSIVLTLVFLTWLAFVKRKMQLRIYYAFCAGLIVLLNVNFRELNMPDIKVSVSDAGYELVNVAKEHGYELDNIYAETNANMYQFMLNRKIINYGFPNMDIEEGIVFSNTEWSGLHPYSVGNYGFHYAQLDNNEYVYVKGEKYVEMLNALGYTPVSDRIVSTTQDLVIEANENDTYTLYSGIGELEKGTYRVKVNATIVAEEVRDVYGYIDVVDSDSVYMNRTNIYDGWLDENRKVELSVLISSDIKMEEVLVRFYLEPGTKMRVHQIDVEKIGEDYDIGADNSRSIAAVADNIEIYNNRYGNYKVYFIDDGYRGDEDNTIILLDALLYNNEVEKISWEEWNQLTIDEPVYVLVYSDAGVASELDWDKGFKGIESFIEHSIYMYIQE